MVKTTEQRVPIVQTARIPYTSLRWECPLSQFEFTTTAEIPVLDSIIAQPRAINALQLGAAIRSSGYNVFVSGLSGTGRLTTVRTILESVCKDKVLLQDFCYVYNFAAPNEPKLLSFPQGLGSAFKKNIDEKIIFLRERMTKLFQEESIMRTRRTLVNKFQQKQQLLLNELNKRIRPSGFVVGEIEDENEQNTQPALLFMMNGEPYTIEQLDELVEKKSLTKVKAKEIRKQYQQYQNELADVIRAELGIAQDFRKALLEHDQLAAGVIVRSTFDEIRSAFSGLTEKEHINTFLHDAEQHFMEHIQFFSEPLLASTIAEAGKLLNEDPFFVYNINVILDNSTTSTAPIIIETTPSFQNLFGTIDKKFSPQTGAWTTDFMLIQSGSLLKANGGFLVMNALDVIADVETWKALKRVLLYGKLEFLQDSSAQLTLNSLKPEAIDVSVKVILIGAELLYETLFEGEEDFKKMFKVNAMFDYETALTPEIMMNYARFIAKICTDEKLPHFDRSGVCAVIEFGVLHAERRERISLIFSDIADVVRESAFIAQSTAGNGKIVKRKDVEKALADREWRNSLVSEKMKNIVLNGEVIIHTEGKRIGEINGLSVYSTGRFSFGQPTRITAAVGMGSAGIINVEREVELGGASHDKGIMILTGFLREKFGQRHGLSLSASLAFEQSYDEIDGDSASSTELYALLSAISQIPIKQEIAVTGSLSQKGEVQAIGGVNEKIEGFFNICQQRGLTGEHGVMIPTSNIEHLMLKREIVEACKKKLFHVWAVSTVDEGIELLTGIPAGEIDEQGIYPENSVYGMIQTRLAQFHESSKEDEGETL